MSGQEWRDGYAKGKETGLELGRKQLIKQLEELGAIRESILGDNWKVIYDSKGALDIPLKRLEGK